LSGIGLLQGAAQSIAMIEASKPEFLLTLALLVPIWQWWLWRQHRQRTPIDMYLWGVMVGLLIVPVLYLLIVGNFTQPSQL